MSARRKLLASDVKNATYAKQVIKYIGKSNIVAYWPLWDASGTVATDISGNNHNGVYSNVTLGAQGIGDGKTAASFNGSTSFVNIYSAALAAAFNGQSLSISLWYKVLSAAVLSDGTARELTRFSADTGLNEARILRNTGNNAFTFVYRAGGVVRTVSITVSSIGWMNISLDASKAGNYFRAYLNGVQQGADQTVGTFNESIINTTTNIGAYTTGPLSVWKGSIAHVLVLNRPMTNAERTFINTL